MIPWASITKPPSAELRPNQTDQDTLPPYPVLDAILEAYVEGDKSLKEITALGVDTPTVRKVVGMVDKPALAEKMKLRPEQRVILSQPVGYPKK